MVLFYVLNDIESNVNNYNNIDIERFISTIEETNYQVDKALINYKDNRFKDKLIERIKKFEKSKIYRDKTFSHSSLNYSYHFDNDWVKTGLW